MPEPATAAMNAMASSCSRLTLRVNALVAPSVFIKATTSRSPVHIPARRHRNRDRAQQHAYEARETEKASGTLDRAFDLRARVADVAQPFGRRLVQREP